MRIGKKKRQNKILAKRCFFSQRSDGNTSSHQPKTDLTFLETGPACFHLLISRQICVATQLQSKGMSIFPPAQNLGSFLKEDTIL